MTWLRAARCYPIMQRSLTIGVSGAIPPALLDALLPGKGVLRRPNAGDLTALSTPAQTRPRLTACGRSASSSFAPCGARRFGLPRRWLLPKHFSAIKQSWARSRKLRHPRRQPHGSHCTTSAPIAGPYWRRHSRSERGPRWPSLESLSAECLSDPTGDPDDRRAGVAIFFGMRTHLQEPCGTGDVTLGRQCGKPSDAQFDSGRLLQFSMTLRFGKSTRRFRAQVLCHIKALEDKNFVSEKAHPARRWAP